MHHMDNLTMEFGVGEQEDDEYEGEEEVFSEEQVQEYAAELLSVSSEQELDYFLGDLIKAAGKAIKSPLGKQIGGILKGVAKKALPVAAGVLGNVVAPGVGGMIGSKLGSAAASLFELELEGMSPEDQEFEAAKQFVRLAADASKNASKAPPGANPARVAKQSMTQAASKYAPGLLNGKATATGSASGAQSGRWVRRGQRIVLLGV
jgi:uncharacterized protein (DUF697 family)